VDTQEPATVPPTDPVSTCTCCCHAATTPASIVVRMAPVERAVGSTDRPRTRRERRLQQQLAENARIAAEVWQTPTVAEEFGLTLPATAWAEWRSGNADATD
jgi:hypothetical protein